MKGGQSEGLRYQKPLLRDLVSQLQSQQSVFYSKKAKDVQVNPEDMRKSFKKKWRGKSITM